jgi:hypothetical protein
VIVVQVSERGRLEAAGHAAAARAGPHQGKRRREAEDPELTAGPTREYLVGWHASRASVQVADRERSLHGRVVGVTHELTRVEFVADAQLAAEAAHRTLEHQRTPPLPLSAARAGKAPGGRTPFGSGNDAARGADFYAYREPSGRFFRPNAMTPVRRDARSRPSSVSSGASRSNRAAERTASAPRSWSCRSTRRAGRLVRARDP